MMILNTKITKYKKYTIYQEITEEKRKNIFYPILKDTLYPPCFYTLKACKNYIDTIIKEVK